MSIQSSINSITQTALSAIGQGVQERAKAALREQSRQAQAVKGAVAERRLAIQELRAQTALAKVEAGKEATREKIKLERYKIRKRAERMKAPTLEDQVEEYKRAFGINPGAKWSENEKR